MTLNDFVKKDKKYKYKIIHHKTLNVEIFFYYDYYDEDNELFDIMSFCLRGHED